LRDVAKHLGAVVKEESLHFYEDEEDDQLIQHVNALSVYVVEKKCGKCGAYAQRERKITGFLNGIVHLPEDVDLCIRAESAKEAFDKVVVVSDDLISFCVLVGLIKDTLILPITRNVRGKITWKRRRSK
jgi:hypothetical protein